MNATSVKYGIDCFINTPDDCKDSIDTLDVDGDKEDSHKHIKQLYYQGQGFLILYPHSILLD